MLQEGGGVMEYVRFKLGEKKYVAIRVQSCDRRAFEVTQAKYTLKKGMETEKSGTCEIYQDREDSVQISALIQPQAKNAQYSLEFTYEIPPEILKHVIQVCVS